MILSDGEVRAMSALALAHMGDAVYEILARREVCRSGKLTAGELHRQTIRYVSAGARGGNDPPASDGRGGRRLPPRAQRSQPCRAARCNGGRVPCRFRTGGTLRVALPPRTKRADRRTLCHDFGEKQCLWTPYFLRRCAVSWKTPFWEQRSTGSACRKRTC